MNASWMTTWRGWRHVLVGAAAAVVLAACGGDGDTGAAPPVAPVADPALADGNSTTPRLVLKAIPPAGSVSAPEGGGTATTLKVHYQRTNGDYTGVMLHTFNAAVAPVWNQGWVPDGTDSFGVYWNVQLSAASGVVGYIFHIGDAKDDNGADQAYTLVAGANEIWRIQDDLTTYTSNPAGAGPVDIDTVRVHYLRYANDYSTWGLHLWSGSGVDAARLGSVAIGDWNNPVAFSAMPGYALAASQVTFDIPVLNPSTHAGASSLQFIIHGMAPNQNDKDGRDSNITVSCAGLAVADHVGEVWLVQQDAVVHTALPDLRSVSTTDQRAVWLTGKVVQWPAVSSGSKVRLYWSNTGQIAATVGAPLAGADGSITLDDFAGALPADVTTRFKWVAAGSRYSVRDADVAALAAMHQAQVVIAQEDAGGNVQNATTAAVPGALDDLDAAATGATLGATVSGSTTTYRLWAPTAQGVVLYRYDTATGNATHADTMAFDAATGIWSTAVPSDTSGTFYRFGVKVFVRGVGLVRNLVTDPYSLTLSADSGRSEVVNLDDARTKPAGWDASTPPATVATSTDQAIYELHVRDFSANDASVPAGHRGKYLAFTDASSNGMKHLAALAAAGLTDVHLMPMFDFSSVPETGCTTPSPSGAPDGPSQQAAVAATQATDCFNWGYDPYHFNAPEGSYATSVADGLTRVREFRGMVQALNAAGLRVGMDVVFNHTTAAGQNDHSVLDEIVPGYYYRATAQGNVLADSCCADTAAENHMMGKLVADSVLVWARDYHVSSFRYDIMGMLPRDVLVALQARVDAAVGHHVEMLGEGWNFGAVANGARFVQAAMYDLDGTGIGSFNPYLRDAVRGGSGFDSGNDMVSHQGFINGLVYDANALGGSHAAGDLLWAGDVVKAGLAGSLRSYVLTTSWDAQLPLDQISIGGSPLGYVSAPSEAVNYVENHDSQTLFDNNAYKLPTTTSADDRARVQMLGAAIVSFSQGVAYFHAGVDTLRSKSLDKNSYDSGDWFNRLDWSYADNNFGVGLPLQASNGGDWPVQQPLLANALVKPAPAQIAWTRDQFRDLLRIRKSTTLLRMSNPDDIKSRLKFYNTGSAQVPTVIVGDIDGNGYAGANFQELAYFINVDKQAHQLVIPPLAGRAFVLHPVHLSAGAADARASSATYDAASGTFAIPARTAVVFVVQ